MLTAFIWVPWLSRFMTVCSCVLNSHHISHYNLCQHRIFRNQHIVYTCQVVSIQLLQVANLKTVSQNWDNVVCIQVSETRIWCLHVKQIFKKKLIISGTLEACKCTQYAMNTVYQIHDFCDWCRLCPFYVFELLHTQEPL